MDPTVEPKNLVSDVWFRVERNKRLSDCDWTQTNDCQLSETKIQEWKVYRQALRDLPETTTPSFDEHRILTDINWPTPPDAEFPELKARLQTIETQANSAIQVLSEFGVSGLMDTIDTSTWPAKGTLAALDARLRPIETGATGARAILDLFGIDDLPEFTVDENSTIESRISALESAGRTAQKTLQDFGVDI